MKNTLWALILTLVAFTTTAQVVQNGDFGLIPGIDYEVAGITVSGVQALDPNVVIMLTNIRVGDNIHSLIQRYQMPSARYGVSNFSRISPLV